MAINTDVPDSPGWWMRRLARKLTARQPRLERLDKWFRGEPPLPIGAENCAEAYRIFQRKCRSNFAELSVEAARERMTPIGIRLRGASADDEEAWAIYRANGLDVEFADVLTNMLTFGDAYTIVGLDDDGEPIITSEDPRQVVTAHDPVQQRRVVAALKVFHDDTDDVDLAYLYLPGEVHVASRQRRVARSPSSVRFSPSTFDWDEERSRDFAPDLSDLMPVTRFRNKRGVGEFEPHIDLLDRINHTILQRMTIATLQAFKQRAIHVSPDDMPDEDEDGKKIDYNEVFTADPGALWKLPETAKLWESGQVDLTPVLSSIKDDVNHFAAVTRTPMHYLEPGGENQSAEGAALSREGLVFRCGDRITRSDDGLRQTFANAFRMRNKKGDRKRADPAGLEIIWAPVERYSLIERAAALVQAQQGGVPFRTRMIEVWGATPASVDRMESERQDDALLAPELNAVPPTPPTA